MTPLRVRDVEAVAVVGPLAAPMRTASGTIETAPLVLVDLRTEEGVVGRSYLFGYQPFTLPALRELVVALGRELKGEPLVPFELERRLRARLTLLGSRGLQGMALAAMDMAAWDALAVAAGLPLATLLGGRPRPIPAYDSLGMVAADDAPGAAERSRARGFRGLKIKLGWPSLSQDLEVVRALRRALPDDVAVMVDFNQSLSAAEAIRRGRALDDEGVAWIEEPVRADDFSGAAQVAAALRTPVMIGENLAGVFELDTALRSRACDLVMPDVQQIGGVSGWLRAAALIQAAGIPCSSHLFVELSSHLLAVTPTCHWLEYLDVASPLLVDPPQIVSGALEAPSRPGSGLTWNPEAVARHRL
jgi:mandelate racemase